MLSHTSTVKDTCLLWFNLISFSFCILKTVGGRMKIFTTF